MSATNRRGFISLKAILFLGMIGGIGFVLFGPLRQWGLAQLDANRERHQEFDRRVKAQRHATIRPELAQAGIHIEEAAAPVDSGVSTESVLTTKPSLVQRAKGWWYRIWGTPAPVEPPPIPVLTDSLGLRPGERAYLPGGRVVEYDTTTFHYQQPTER